ncbi:YceI family protein [Sulfobacillus acidophilus TPY]|uniref:YceI family protein n=1 Tax=Sulfobacillus acidophilus (strain ATCC 700253 / DSM 10332 / NAL) TaxID=679936 RepID=G8U1E3_SULAD|nr:YceI family protein [Sulfobacillus acidophilus TPY]AEW05463.1 YceI family protein [Sulfobacillus acidophilus DSM 10332]
MASNTWGTWEIDPSHSTAEFRIRHLMISTVRGRFSDFSGQIVGDPADLTTAKATLTIDVASVDTRQPDRDNDLRSANFFDVANYPQMTFESTQIKKIGENTYEVTGPLTIHGVTHEVPVKVEFLGFSKDPWGGERAGFTASTKINRKDFGLTWNAALETGGVLVGEEVTIEVELETVKKA